LFLEKTLNFKSVLRFLKFVDHLIFTIIMLESSFQTWSCQNADPGRNIFLDKTKLFCCSRRKKRLNNFALVFEKAAGRACSVESWFCPDHIEAKHVVHPTYSCSFCGKHCSSRKSYRVHFAAYHKQK
jgi:hypothetical protein